MIGSMLVRTKRALQYLCSRPLGLWKPYRIVDRLLMTGQCCMFWYNSCSREDLNECSTNRYVLAYVEVEFAKFGK